MIILYKYLIELLKFLLSPPQREEEKPTGDIAPPPTQEGGVVEVETPPVEAPLPPPPPTPRYNFRLRLLVQTVDSTISVLEHNGNRIAYALEDGNRLVKIPGETRIPAGIYRLRQKSSGNFLNKYRSMYGHQFVVEVMDVPGFTGILFHQGNTIRDTRGCILLGDTYRPTKNNNFVVHESQKAYLAFYIVAAKEFAKGEVWLEVVR